MNTSKLICLVAVLKGEEKIIDEWLVYHKMIGIDHFFLYDDDPDQGLEKYLKPHSEYITVINWRLNNEAQDSRGNQIAAYNHAFKNYIQSFEWVVFLDGDEFIVLRQHSSIKEFLLSFNEEVAVCLNWHMFGHNGFFEDPTRLITTSLTRRMLLSFPAPKSITKTNAISGITSPHTCLLKYGAPVDANHRLYTEEVYEGKTEIANINHYHCRSFKHWMRRVERGHINYNNSKVPDSQKWRFNEELCLKRFISMIARDKNEYVDEFMFQYRFEILENINKLGRRHLNLKDYLTFEQQTLVRSELKSIAETLLIESTKTNNIGLFNGNSGIAVFLFHYSRLVNEDKYKNAALNILDKITEEITEYSAVNIFDGISGYGIAIEHLLSESFIKIDTDEFLEDIDTLAKYYFNIKSFSEQSDFFNNILDIGRYYIARYNNPVNPPRYDKDGNKDRQFEEVIGFIRPLANIHECIEVLNIYCIGYMHRDNKQKALEDIKQIVNRIKQLLDIPSNELFEAFDPLFYAEILLNFSKIIQENFFYNLAKGILLTYEEKYWDYIVTSKFEDSFNIRTATRYLRLAEILANDEFTEKGKSYLGDYIFQDINAVMENINLKETIPYGLSLLTLANDSTEYLYDLI